MKRASCRQIAGLLCLQQSTIQVIHMKAIASTLLLLTFASCNSTKTVKQDLHAPHGTIVVANMSDDTVMLVDGASGDIVRTIPSGPAPHEVAVSEDGRWAVVTNYGDRNRQGNNLTVIDIDGQVAPRTIDLGIYDRPHGIIFIPGTMTVAVTSESNSSVVFVNVESGAILKAVSTDQKASHMVARGINTSSLFTTNIVSGSISEINPEKDEKERVITVGPMIEGIAVSPAADQIWVGANREGKVLVVDTEQGEVVGSVDNFGFPYRMTFTSDGTSIIISDPQNGVVKIIDPATRNERHSVTFDESLILSTAEIPGSTSPEGLVVDETDRFVYISMQGLNKVAVVEISTGTVLRYYDVGVWPDGIGYSPRKAK